MLRTALIAIGLFVAVLIATASGSASLDERFGLRNDDTATRGSIEEAKDEVREEFHQNYPLAGNGRFSLENVNGDVRITVWDRNELQVNAVKRASTRQRLNEARIEVNATPDFVRIETKYPQSDLNFSNDEKIRHNNPAVVEYSIQAPRAVRLESINLVNGALDVEGVEGNVKGSTVNGRISARGLMGEAKLSTVNGPVEAIFSRLEETKPIAVSSVNGPVVLIIPSDSNAIVRANTISGSINNDFGLDVQHGEYVGHDLYGQLGTGGPRIKLGNVSGTISIKHAQDGRKLSPATCLLAQKDKDKDKYKSKSGDETGDIAEHARQLANEVQREVLSHIDTAKITREAQREVERAIRDSQREIERAQREIQREIERQTREQLRTRNRGEGGAASGRGHGEVTSGRRFVERDSKSFAVSGTPRVNIGTFGGSVSIHGWDKSEVMYEATKHSADAEEMKQISITAHQDGSALSIVANAPEGNGSTSFDVHVPRNTDLHLSSDEGRLSVEGVYGELTLRTGDGTIEVNTGRGKLQANTGDGQIKITNFEGDVDARTEDGPIFLDGNFSALGARTGDGTILLAVPAGSNFTIETSADDAVSNEGLTISEDIAPSKRVKRWKIGNGGNVFVVSTGHGKIILRPR